MKTTLKTWIIFGILVTTSTMYAQLNEAWLGYWKGKLEIFDAKGVRQMVNMELEINRIDSTRW